MKEGELSAMHRRDGTHVETKLNSDIVQFTPVSVKQIVIFKKTALRRGIWFRALGLVEREKD